MFYHERSSMLLRRIQSLAPLYHHYGWYLRFIGYFKSTNFVLKYNVKFSDISHPKISKKVVYWLLFSPNTYFYQALFTCLGR